MPVQSSYYSVDGSSVKFPSTKHIATKSHLAVWLQLISDDSYVQLEVAEYELINNAAVLTNAPDVKVYQRIEVRVADHPDELLNSPSDIAVVASISSEVVIVAGATADIAIVAADIASVVATATDIANVNIVAADIANVNAVAADIASVNVAALDILNIVAVATDIANVNTVAGAIADVSTIAPYTAEISTCALNIADIGTCATNIAAIIAASTHATNAAASATSAELSEWEAEAWKMTAQSYATEAEDVLVNLWTSDGDGTFTPTPTTVYSALHHAAKSQAFSLTAVQPDDYATSTVGGTVKMRLTGTELFLRNDGTDA